MPLSFTAIDFETANGSAASACSVGLVKVVDSKIVDRDSWFIRPPSGHDSFLEWNIRIHGITPAMIVDAPDWADQQQRILEFAGDDVFVAHNAGFDMGVMKAAAKASGMPVPESRWADSLRIARKTYSLDSYRLPVAAMAAGFEDFKHHDAAADAEACAAIVVHAAARHEASSLDHLLKICAARYLQIGPEADAEKALEAWWR
ncbi:exonuclease domain-containing protein [Agrococcus casei]|uniref:DNA polymerase III epsilon subunit n=1 Tax=Agrococcus casei LMG 22410 TaxID=1255656 RepID=A0A1R4G343_9MICO|nr:exonuclease domain-containing protein [Agrococcus casei]SJM62402.1 DNA polymerase III epsilon subunit [Agrococcus casei LMG 22410]